MSSLSISRRWWLSGTILAFLLVAAPGCLLSLRGPIPERRVLIPNPLVQKEIFYRPRGLGSTSRIEVIETGVEGGVR